MAVGFPYPTVRFMDLIADRTRSFTFFPLHANEYSQTGRGEVIAASIGSSLWRGKITLRRMTNAQAREVRALLSLLCHFNGSFWCYDPGYPGPALDPGGVILGSATPSLNTATSNGRDVAIKGLPPNYRLSVGDYVSWDYGSPTRSALHQLTVANNSPTGDPSLQLTPMVQNVSLAIDTPINFIRPTFIAKVLANTVEIGDDQSVISDGASFEFTQVLGR